MISAIPSNPSNVLDPDLMQQIGVSNAHFFKLKLFPMRSDSLETIMKKAEGIFEETQKGYPYYSLGQSLRFGTEYPRCKEIKLSLVYMYISRLGRRCSISFGKPERRDFVNYFTEKKDDVSLLIACDLLLSTHRYREMLTIVKTEKLYWQHCAYTLVKGLHMVSLARFAEKGVYEKEFFEFLDFFQPPFFMAEYSKKAFSIGLDRFSSEIDNRLLRNDSLKEAFMGEEPEAKLELDERMRKRYTLQLIMALSKDSHDLKHAPEAKQET